MRGWMVRNDVSTLHSILRYHLTLSADVVAENQYHDIISASDAWQIADDEPDHDDTVGGSPDIKTTNSARRVKALIEQVTGDYFFVLCIHVLFAH